VESAQPQEKAGVPTADVRGNIPSHRARTTIASQLYNAREPMTLFEWQQWLGHSSPAATQHYAKITPLKIVQRTDGHHGLVQKRWLTARAYKKFLQPIEKGTKAELHSMEIYEALMRKNDLKIVRTEILNKHCAKTWDLCLGHHQRQSVLVSCRQAWSCVRSLFKSVEGHDRWLRLWEFHLRPDGRREALTNEKAIANRIRRRNPEPGRTCGRSRPALGPDRPQDLRLRRARLVRLRQQAPRCKADLAAQPEHPKPVL
jgi:hypothetical protein